MRTQPMRNLTRFGTYGFLSAMMAAQLMADPGLREIGKRNPRHLKKEQKKAVPQKTVPGGKYEQRAH